MLRTILLTGLLVSALSDSACGEYLGSTGPSYAAPYAGQINHAHTAPSFRWGWFGAEHFYPSVQWHRGYYGEKYRWSKQRRY